MPRRIKVPRYFFDFENGQPHRDDVGESLQDDKAAWCEALRHARDIEDVLAPGGSWSLQVREKDETIFRINVTTEWLR